VKEEKWVNLRPEYQRRLVWSRKKKSLFIESLLMNIPIPPIFLYETDLNRYEVMDGQQRLNAILEFYGGDLVLTGLETWSVLNGLRYNQCPPRIQRGLDRRRISANVLVAENIDPRQADFIRRTVFERLNTGGMQLNAQELRNSLYTGSFNDLLIELAGTRLFDEIWGIPPYEDHYRKNEGFISADLADNDLFSRMSDCEIVLRFFAFRDHRRIKGSVRRILDDYMRDHRSLPKSQIDGLRAAFLSRLETAHEIFGNKTFQVRDAKGKWRMSRPLFDAVMVSIDKLQDHKRSMIASKKRINEALIKKLRRGSVYEIIVGKPNTAKAIKKRINIVYKLLRQYC
jgi:hypothetical protein